MFCIVWVCVSKYRKDFPFFNKNNSAFLDTAASSQKPMSVLESMTEVYDNYSNVHRGFYSTANELTYKIEKSRSCISDFINSVSKNEIVFTKNATESINLIAYAYGDKFVKKHNNIFISSAEHHSNIIPWQRLCHRTGASLNVFSVNDIDSIEFNKDTSIVAFSHMSNVMGYVLPVEKIVKKAHDVGAVVLVDACQSIAHLEVDVQLMDCDFLVFSGHKMYGPTGIGICYGKQEILRSMDVYQTGGSMVSDVSYDKTTFQDIPFKFEAGTLPIAEIVGLESAIKYYTNINYREIFDHEKTLLSCIKKGINSLKGYKLCDNLIDSNLESVAIVSFYHDRFHPSDVCEILDKSNVSVRCGHHCAQPFVKSLGLDSTIRASLGIYNSKEDIFMLLNALERSSSILN